MGELVSVVIPAYNRAHTIAHSIESVLAQTYQELEILIVDDGSTDGTGDVVKGFEDARIRYVQHDKNLGVSAARNTGIQIANGLFVAFLDSDDTWFPKKIQKQVQRLKNFGEDFGGVYTGIIVNAQGSKRELVPLIEGRFTIPFLLGTVDLAAGSTLLVKKDCFERVGFFDTNLKRYEDVDFLVRMFRHYSICTVPEVLANINYYYNKENSNLEIDCLYLIRKIKNSSDVINSVDLKIVLAHIYKELSKHIMYGSGKKRTAIKYLIKSIVIKKGISLKDLSSFILMTIFRLTKIDLRRLGALLINAKIKFRI